MTVLNLDADQLGKTVMERLESFMNVKWPGAGPGNPVNCQISSMSVVKAFTEECDKRGWNCTYDARSKSFYIVKRYGGV